MNFLPITKELLSSELIQDSDFLKELLSSVIAIYPGGVPEMPWAGYLVEDKGVIVGSCAYKSQPVSGEVEIAYFTFPHYEGKGFATRMARYLFNVAVQNGVTTVVAQTLPQTNASTHILQKMGFKHMGTVLHPEDGEVWEWKKVT